LSANNIKALLRMEDRLLKRDLPEWQTLVDVDIDAVGDYDSSVKATPRADVSAGLWWVSTPHHASPRLV
ncbi:hypothetical protein FRC03_001882, partial [Tulasnella sp. 419]